MRVIFLASLLLIGCSSTTKLVNTGDLTQHPKMPEPIFCSKLTSNSIQSSDGKPAIMPDAVFSIGACQQDTLRYIRDMEVTLCFYRENINEPRCRIYREDVKAMRSSIREEQSK